MKATEEKVILDKKGISKTIARMCEQIVRRNKTRYGLKDLAIVGIRTRGAYIAQRIVNILKRKYKTAVPIGILDITLYRDDLTTVSAQPVVRSTEIPFDLMDKRVVLVDDVLYTGRTVRAAMDELVDFGRPRNIQLAVLVDRGWREFPIQADYTGVSISTTQSEIVEVRLRESDGRDEVVVRRR